MGPEDGNRTPASYRSAAAATGGLAKFAYVIPEFSDPTGLKLSLAARKNVLKSARDLDVRVFEDTAYAALRFEGQALPSLQAMDIDR